MSDLNRRDAMKFVAAAPAAAAFGALSADAIADEAVDPKSLDRQAVLAAGMTEAEADCWELAGKLAGQMLNLPCAAPDAGAGDRPGDARHPEPPAREAHLPRVSRTGQVPARRNRNTSR